MRIQKDDPMVGSTRTEGRCSSREKPLAILLAAALLVAIPGLSFAQAVEGKDHEASESAQRESAVTSPDSVSNQLELNREEKSAYFGLEMFEPWRNWKAKVADDTGIQFNIDYNVLGFKATDSVGDDSALSGVFRFYGKWELIGRGTNDTGSLIFKYENRSAYGDYVAPFLFGPELGYAAVMNCCFSDQGWRTSTLYWRQSFNDQRVVTYAGFIDVTEFTDVYPLASPWIGFNNLVFATGSGSIGGLPDGTFGAMAAVWVSDSLYVVGGIGDANVDQTDVFEGFNTFFDKFETFKSLNLHWTPERDSLFFDNTHVTFWQIDEREEAGTPSGYGVNLSVTRAAGNKFLPFVRGGWSKDGGSVLEASLSVGFGYQDVGVTGAGLFGVGLNWGRPNENTFGTKLKDQYTAEVFYRWRILQDFSLTPSIQLIVDPALNPDDDFIAVFGLRTAIIF